MGKGKVILTYFKVPVQYLPGEMQENHEIN